MPEKAKELKGLLNTQIKAVGVFMDEKVETVAKLLNDGIIDIAQLHGNENDEYIKKLRGLSEKPIIKAFRVVAKKDIADIEICCADYVLLDSGTGSGKTFDWELIRSVKRPYFLAGGLGLDNVESAIKLLHPFALDVSSGIESNGIKDKDKMTAFAHAVRKENKL